MNKHLLFFDFETFYSTDDRYDLLKISMVEYVRDSRFKAFGMGVAEADGKPRWYGADDIGMFLATYGVMAGGWENVTLVGHNIKFDGFILKEIYGVTAGQYIDTMAMSRAILGKSIKSHSLQTLAEFFKLVSKGHLDTNNKNVLTAAEMQALAEYCLHDVELCREIYSQLAKKFPQNQYAAMHQTIKMFVAPKLQLNVAILEKCAIDEAKRRADIFKTIGIDKSEFASNVKFPALMRKYGYDVPMKPSPRKKDANGEPVMIPALALGDTEFLELLESENEELKMLCEARVAAKSTLLETRSTKLAKIGATGAWPFDVEYSGATQTQRFSGGSGAGGNPQNFTRGSALRDAVEAPEGYEIGVGDFSNIELRIVAYLSKDPGLVGAIEKGIDLYCDFASVFYGRSITKADKRERQFGKTAILGLGYGCGWRKFQKMVRIQTGESISDEDAKKAVDLYRTRYAQVPALWERFNLEIEVMTRGGNQKLGRPYQFGHECIILPSGLEIKFMNLRLTQGDRGYTEWVYDAWVKGHLETQKLYGGKVLENISQSLAGELCKEAMVKMGDDAVGQCHDELLAICKKGLGGITAAKLKRVMSVSPSWLPQMQLAAEVHTGRSWLEAK